MTVGPDGPILLHDHYFIDQLAQFNRERVPERQAHAKGSGALGRFEVTHYVSAFTTAAVFQPGTTTETVIRFSTVAGVLAHFDRPFRREDFVNIITQSTCPEPTRGPRQLQVLPG